MRLSMRIGVAAAAIVAGGAFALAQQSQPDQSQRPAQVQGAQPPDPANTARQRDQLGDAEHQSQANRAQNSQSGQGGKEEPGSHASTSQSGSETTGSAAQPPATASGQTMPSKYSPRNAALDKLPIMAFPLDLTDAQRQRVYDVLTKAGAPVVAIDAKPAEALPAWVELFDLPDYLVKDVPALKGLKYVRLADRILLVRAPNMIVVGEVSG